jgi:hypothetical protein
MIEVTRRHWWETWRTRLPAALAPYARRWQAFAATPLGARLIPLYALLAGAAVGALLGDRTVRSMWEHTIFTGPQQWRTVGILLVLLWLVVGAVAALGLLGRYPAAGDADES